MAPVAWRGAFGMSVSSLAASVVGLQAQQTQSQIGTAVLKQQFNAQAAVLQLLQPSPELLQANLPPGVGDSLDVKA